MDSRALADKLQRKLIGNATRMQSRADRAADEDWANEGGSSRQRGTDSQVVCASDTYGQFRKGEWAIIVNNNGARHAILGDDYDNCRYEPPFAELMSAEDYDELLLSRMVPE